MLFTYIYILKNLPMLTLTSFVSLLWFSVYGNVDIILSIFLRHHLLGSLTLCWQHVVLQFLLIRWCQIEEKMQIRDCLFLQAMLTSVYPFHFLVWLVKVVPETIKIVGGHQCLLGVNLHGSQPILRIPNCLQLAGIVLWCVTRKKRKHASKY